MAERKVISSFKDTTSYDDIMISYGAHMTQQQQLIESGQQKEVVPFTWFGAPWDPETGKTGGIVRYYEGSQIPEVTYED